MASRAGRNAGFISGQMASPSFAAHCHMAAIASPPSQRSGACVPATMRKPRTPCRASARIADSRVGGFIHSGHAGKHARVRPHRVQHVRVVESVVAHLDQHGPRDPGGPRVSEEFLRRKAGKRHLLLRVAGSQRVTPRIGRPDVDMGVDAPGLQVGWRRRRQRVASWRSSHSRPRAPKRSEPPAATTESVDGPCRTSEAAPRMGLAPGRGCPVPISFSQHQYTRLFLPTARLYPPGTEFRQVVRMDVAVQAIASVVAVSSLFRAPRQQGVRPRVDSPAPPVQDTQASGCVPTGSFRSRDTRPLPPAVSSPRTLPTYSHTRRRRCRIMQPAFRGGDSSRRRPKRPDWRRFRTSSPARCWARTAPCPRANRSSSAASASAIAAATTWAASCNSPTSASWPSAT